MLSPIDEVCGVAPADSKGKKSVAAELAAERREQKEVQDPLQGRETPRPEHLVFAARLASQRTSHEELSARRVVSEAHAVFPS